MVWDGLEPGASVWDRSSVYFEKPTMASGWSRERVSDYGNALWGQRAGQSGDVFEDELTKVADGVGTEYEREENSG